MGADVQFRVWDPVLSVLVVKDLVAATRMTAQNAMTKALGKKSLREIHAERLRIGEQLLVRAARGFYGAGTCGVPRGKDFGEGSRVEGQCLLPCMGQGESFWVKHLQNRI